MSYLLHTAIRELNPSVATIRGEDAFDENDNPVSYDKAAAQAKTIEIHAIESAKYESELTAKQSAHDKLAALGLTEEEIAALGK